MNDLQAKIKAGQDKFAGKVDAPLAPIPPEYTRPTLISDRKEVTAEPQPNISDLAEQQAKEAFIRESTDRYKIVKDALENCLAQAQHMRGNPETAVEALRQIEMLAVAALAQG